MAKTTYVVVDPKTKQPVKQPNKQKTDSTTAPYVPASTKQVKPGLQTDKAVATPPSAPKSTNVSQGLKGISVATPQEQATHQQGYTADVGSAKPLNPTQQKKYQETFAKQTTPAATQKTSTTPSYTYPSTEVRKVEANPIEYPTGEVRSIQARELDLPDIPDWSDAYRQGINTDYYRNAINEYTQQANEERNRQLSDAGNSWNNALRQAYIQNMQNQRKLDESLASSGVRGGASETARLALANQYGTARAVAGTDYANSVNSINRSIDQNIRDYTSDMNSRAEEYVQNLANARWNADVQKTENAIERMREDEANRVTREREDEANAYARQMDILGMQREDEANRINREREDEATEYARRMDVLGMQREDEANRIAREREDEANAYARSQDALAIQREDEQRAYERKVAEDQTKYEREQAEILRKREDEANKYEREQAKIAQQTEYWSNYYINLFSGYSKKQCKNILKGIDDKIKKAKGNEKIRLQQQKAAAGARLGVIANK